MLLIKIFLIYLINVIFASTDCNIHLPSKNGIFFGLPPYWQLPHCHNQAFDIDDTKKCLFNRTIYIIGNSVARQSAFNILEMMGSSEVSRTDQKKQCPKHETTWDDSCHQEFEHVKIKYLFLQFFDGYNYTDRNGFPYYRVKNNEPDINGSYWSTQKLEIGWYIDDSGHNITKYMNEPNDEKLYKEDNCISKQTKNCLQNFFKDSKSNDILIFTLGMSYMTNKHINLELDPSYNEPHIDYLSWLIDSAIAFKGYLSNSFNGEIFHITIAETNKNSFVNDMNLYLVENNKILNSIWKHTAALPWYHIDAWEINKNRYYLYNDHVHYNGVLTFAALHQILNELCPKGGKDTWYYDDPNNNIEKLPPFVVTFNYNERFFVYNNTKYRIPDQDTYEGLKFPSKWNLIFNPKDSLDPSSIMMKKIKNGGDIKSCDLSSCLSNPYLNLLNSLYQKEGYPLIEY